MDHTNNNNNIITSEDPPPTTSANNTTLNAETDQECNLDQANSAPWTEDPAQMTCDVLCSLSKSMNTSSNNSRNLHNDHNHDEEDGMESMGSADREKLRGKGCPKQHQLPLFLSST